MKSRDRRFRTRPGSRFYPWSSRDPRNLFVKRRFERPKGVFYHLMSNGEIQRPEHERHERSVLEMSPRQHRREKKRLRRLEKEQRS